VHSSLYAYCKNAWFLLCQTKKQRQTVGWAAYSQAAHRLSLAVDPQQRHERVSGFNEGLANVLASGAPSSGTDAVIVDVSVAGVGAAANAACAAAKMFPGGIGMLPLLALGGVCDAPAAKPAPPEMPSIFDGKTGSPAAFDDCPASKAAPDTPADIGISAILEGNLEPAKSAHFCCSSLASDGTRL
jgi:hypothetical protein